MKRIGVYFIYDDNDEVIYIGKSSNLDKRIKTSCEAKKGKYVRVAEMKNKIDATIYESYYISKLSPKLNKYYSDYNESSIDLPPIQLGDKIDAKDILIEKRSRRKKNLQNNTKAKELRQLKGLTQVEFAKLLGTTQMTVSTWENGKCPAYIDKLAELAIRYLIKN